MDNNEFIFTKIENPRVGGSNPPPGTITFNDLAEYPLSHFLFHGPYMVYRKNILI